jgi:2-desacetyl-2-hydroxyethyl bacteriochlorophyllide A dehydrogenase
MKALVIDRPGALAVRDVPEPSCGPDDVVVRTARVGICHSDFDLLDGRYILPVPYPVIPGHEWCGQVVEVGAHVRDLRVGDRAVGEAGISDTDHFGFTTDGAAAEYARVPARLVHRLPDELDEAQGALVEPFTIAFRGYMEPGGAAAGDLVCVLGGGTIGLCSLAVAKAHSATVAVVEPDATRRDICRTFGADMVLDPWNGDVGDQLRAVTGTDGAGLVIEASGVAASLDAMLDVAAPLGRIASVGINVDGLIAVRLGLVNSKQLRIWGINGSAGVWPAAIRLLVERDLDLRPLVAATFPLSQALTAYQTAKRPEGGVKVHIDTQQHGEDA